MTKFRITTRDVRIVFAELNEGELADVSAYSQFLRDKRLPTIYSGAHLSLLLGVDPSYLYGVSNAPEAFYRKFVIRKANGGRRKIYEPLPLLKAVQRWILDEILEKVDNGALVKSYRKGMGVKTNAKFHVKQKYLIKLDIKEFFDHISVHRVYKIFFRAGYSEAVSTLLARLCVREEVVCQGSPTSGAISNIVLSDFDSQAFEYCRSRGLRYTRYSDDISISGALETKSECREVVGVIDGYLREAGFSQNAAKTKIIGQNSQQRVTGIVVNQKMSAPRAVRDQFRKEMYFIERFGPNGHAS